jgi:hypothetical protein
LAASGGVCKICADCHWCEEVAMFTRTSMRNRLRLPSRIALLLGLGALSASGTKADTGEVQSDRELVRSPQQSVKTFGDLLIWSDGERIYVAESGKEAQELPLGGTPEAHRLRGLLAREGATARSPRALLDRVILVGGGGEGFHWAPARQSEGRDETNRSATRAPEKPPAPGLKMPVGQAGVAQQPDIGPVDTKK